MLSGTLCVVQKAKSMAFQSIPATKYHLIPSMRLIAQLFLIFIYLFTSSLYRMFDDKYCARPVANAALDEAQTDCVYIKLAIYYVFFSRKIKNYLRRLLEHAT